MNDIDNTTSAAPNKFLAASPEEMESIEGGDMARPAPPLDFVKMLIEMLKRL